MAFDGERRFGLAAALALLAPLLSSGQPVGKPLSAWQPGYFDIHQINTGRGDSALLVLPDGTSLLVDAGDGQWAAGDPRRTAAKPDGSRPAGEWIARYARRVLAHDREPAIDYAFVTHFHGDHIGEAAEPAPLSGTGAYRRTGLSEVAEHIPIRRILDRGWPDYAFPAPPADPTARNYIAFVRARSDIRVERFRPGAADQIVLVREAGRYRNFSARNIAANGEVWTGVGTETRHQFPADYQSLPKQDWPTENQCSMAVRLSYGAFDYYTGGDIPGRPLLGGPAWMDIETPVAQAVGPVEVAVLNHHGNRDSQNAFFVSALRPQIWVIPVWSSDHPGHDVLERMLSPRLYPGERTVLATNMMQVNKDVIGEMLNRLASDQGHIVIRVEPGGDTFRAFVLDDSDESMRVKQVLGPFRSR